MNRALVLLAVVLSIGCGNAGPGVVVQQKDSEEKRDTTPPIIEHDPVEGFVYAGTAVPISCTVTDPDMVDKVEVVSSGILMAEVFYKQETTEEWLSQNLAAGDAGTYSGEIPATFVGNGSSGFHYYLHALDGSNNESFFPDGGANDPIHVRVSVE